MMSNPRAFAKYSFIKMWRRTRVFIEQVSSYNRLAGRIVERMGNKACLAGQCFDLSHPCIVTGLKARFLFRSYEWAERSLVARYLPTDLPVFEFGGCLGVVACFVNHRLRHPMRHTVVEANEQLITVLEANRRMNQCSFDIVHGMLGYGAESLSFQPSGWVTGSKRGEGSNAVQVKTVTVESIASERGVDRFCIIADVEGAEFDLIDNEARYLGCHAEWIVLEVHNDMVSCDKANALFNRLTEVGFEQVDNIRNVYAFRNALLCGIESNGVHSQ